ncbi:MAG: tetratricopeptide repeat protein [Halobacteria archaeon]|nr:tetratricopeptide repeat protein [Halobacteria archaeon]
MKSLAAAYRAIALLATTLAVFLQGCATPTYYPPRPGDQAPPVIEQGTGVPVEERMPPPVIRPTVPTPVQPPVDRPQPPAVVALLDTAEQQANTGDLEAAAASLERAIRIDPRNPALWYHLATVRLSQGEARAAEQLAVKSNSLSTGNKSQQARNWELIARARRAQNDTAGAKEAEQKARALR